MIILLINFGLYIATAALQHARRQRKRFMNLDVPDADRVRRQVRSVGLMQGEWWRLVTAGFLHGGMIHILMNSWVLFDLGAQVEEVYGASRMLVIYFLSTVFGYLCQRRVESGRIRGSFGRHVRPDRRDDRARRAAPQPDGDGHSRHVHARRDLRPDLRPAARLPHR